MKCFATALAVFTALAVQAFSSPVLADPGVADPGFSYVDMNNDGLYSAAAGDVDVEALITNDGQFNTQQNEGFYQAPCWAVSLVIPRSRDLSQTTFNLQAGYNLIVHGRLTASTICLQACRNVDLTLSELTFVSAMQVDAGCNVILDGTTITGDFLSDSTLNITACGNITGLPVDDGGITFVTAIAAGSQVNLCAGGCIDLDGAAIIVLQPDAALSIVGSGSVDVNGGTSLSAPQGDVIVRSQCSSVNLDGDFIQGNSLLADASTSASFTSASIQTNGTTTVHAGGSVAGDSAIITCGDLYVTSNAAVNMNDTTILSTGDIEVTGRNNVNVNGLNGAPLPTLAWTAGTHILVKSTKGDVNARFTRMVNLALLGPITFYAGGGDIDVTGSVLLGMVTYGPFGVRVTGP